MTDQLESEALLQREEETLKSVLESLASQRKKAEGKLSLESERARELTSALVAAKRVEDKAMMASDEAVAHGLRDKIGNDLKILSRLTKQPYFGRIVVQEQDASPTGGNKELEYRLGYSENAECRIIDWRRAPLAKLYYEYREGEEYSEEILGRERCGLIKMRNSVDIRNGVLRRVRCRFGEFEKIDGQWKALLQAGRGRLAQSEGERGDHHLPEIAALLSPDQFSLIGDSRDRALLIQGIAGSGKTTVALHRLAFLIGAAADPQAEFEPPLPERSIILVLSAALKTYVSRTLPSLGVLDVKVLTLSEWMYDLLRPTIPQFFDPDLSARLSKASVPTSIDRLKRSLGLLRALEEIQNKSPRQSPSELVLAALSDHQLVAAMDETKLIDKQLVSDTLHHTHKNFEQRMFDLVDAALLLRAAQLQSPQQDVTGQGKYDHIVADEVQDMSPVELACIVAATSKPSALTLVGDTAQQMSESAFPGWEKLRRYWGFRNQMAQFVTLSLSYRSTQQILKLASHVRADRSQTAASSGNREGRIPIFFACTNEAQALSSAKSWLLKAAELYPGSLNALVTRTSEEAKYIYSLLQPAFGHVLRLGSNYDFTFFEGLVVCGAEQVKGLEFNNVVIWNVNRKHYPNDALHRNILYTIITRASDNLCLINWHRPSELLPGANSGLMRVNDLTGES